MKRFPVETPKPPYYSVTTTASVNDKYDQDKHVKVGLALYSEAELIDGFLGWEVMTDTDFGIAITYWRSLEAIELWRTHHGHLRAKQLGKTWFSHCMTRIAFVERDYGFKGSSSTTPQSTDSEC